MVVEQPRLAIFLAFFGLLVLAGGVARWDALPLLVIRPAAVLTIGMLLIVPGPWNWAGLRIPMALLSLFALTIAIQLVPLPPSLWTHLPGRAAYLQAAVVAGLPQPWRPISLIPDRTAGSLLDTLPAFAALIAMAGIPRREWRILALAITILPCASALLGALQYGTGALYPYSPSDTSLPIGLLANRNHQALLLAVGILLVAQWGTGHGWNGPEAHGRIGAALAAVLVLSTVALLTGSRTGFAIVVLAVLAVDAAVVIRLLRDKRRSPIGLAIAFVPLAMIALGAYVAQNSSVVRLSNSIGRLDEDMRALALPTMWKMAWTYFPWGGGFGIFDRLFMQFEPESLIKRTFFNRAHNDALEVMITGGLPSLLVLLAFLLWYVRSAVRAFAGFRRDRSYLPQAAALAILCMLAASLVDYPLRTPLLSVVFVLLCGLCHRDPSAPRPDPRQGLGT